MIYNYISYIIITILHLCHGRHVENILPVVLLGEVDVVEEEGEVLEHPLGEVEMDCRTLEEANVENSLPHAASVFNLHMVQVVQN